MDEVLLTENRGPVRILTLNRPAKLNALNGDLIHALTDAMLAADADDGVSVVILAGAGRAFSAGADTSVPRPLTEENRPNLIRHGEAFGTMMKTPSRIKKPVIAAVHGYALGGGFGLAIASDMVVAAESARFGFPELKAGLTPTTVTAQAVHAMGKKIAFELLMVCENIAPQRAYDLGLINRIVPDDALMTEAMALATKLTVWTSEQLWLGKRTFYRAADMAGDDALDMARDVSVMMGRFPK